MFKRYYIRFNLPRRVDFFLSLLSAVLCFITGLFWDSLLECGVLPSGLKTVPLPAVFFLLGVFCLVRVFIFIGVFISNIPAIQNWELKRAEARQQEIIRSHKAMADPLMPEQNENAATVANVQKPNNVLTFFMQLIIAVSTNLFIFLAVRLIWFLFHDIIFSIITGASLSLYAVLLARTEDMKSVLCGEPLVPRFRRGVVLFFWVTAIPLSLWFFIKLLSAKEAANPFLIFGFFTLFFISLVAALANFFRLLFRR